MCSEQAIHYDTPEETEDRLAAALRAAFPAVTFTIRRSEYALGACLAVRYTDGPALSRVDAVAARFAGSTFDPATARRKARPVLEVDAGGQERYVVYGVQAVSVDRFLSWDARSRIHQELHAAGKTLDGASGPYWQAFTALCADLDILPARVGTAGQVA